MRRIPAEERLDAGMLERIKGTPWAPTDGLNAEPLPIGRHPEHKQILQAMEYDGQAPPLDFSFRAFDPENGSKGKCPVTAEEWQKVGIREPKERFRRL